MIRLARSGSEWGVYCTLGFFPFPNIEVASDYLVSKLKVKDDEIDEALIQMFSLNKAVAVFDYEGNFVKTANL